FERDRLPHGPAHRGFDRDRAYRGGIRWSRGPLDGLRDFVGGEDGTARAERHEIQPAEELRTIALVSIEVALLLDERLATLSGQHSNGEVVGERSGGEEQRLLLAEDGGHPRFEILHGTVLEVTVAAKTVLLGNGRQQSRVVSRGGIQPVAIK